MYAVTVLSGNLAHLSTIETYIIVWIKSENLVIFKQIMMIIHYFNAFFFRFVKIAAF